MVGGRGCGGERPWAQRSSAVTVSRWYGQKSRGRGGKRVEVTGGSVWLSHECARQADDAEVACRRWGVGSYLIRVVGAGVDLWKGGRAQDGANGGFRRGGRRRK